MKTFVKVIIPLYKTNISDFEKKILINNLNVLSKHPIVFICPESLNISELISSIDKSINICIERFNDNYFRSVDGYNELMLSSEFYSRFLDTEYILICQTDAFVFKDELILWCKKGYDYIGGPWIGSKDNKYVNLINHILHQLKLRKKRVRWHLFNVGNGGFSLRKVESLYKITNEYSSVINGYLSEDKSDPQNTFATEDLFWSFKSKELDPQFVIPNYIDALSFAIDQRPEKAMKLNRGKLPFGIHGLKKENIRKYWEPYIDKAI